MVSLKNVADVTFFDLETGEHVFHTDAIKSVEVDYDNAREYDIERFIKLIKISLNDINVYGANLAYILGLEHKPTIKRLIYLYNKAKKKRIKNKLNKRILNEISKHI